MRFKSKVNILAIYRSLWIVFQSDLCVIRTNSRTLESMKSPFFIEKTIGIELSFYLIVTIFTESHIKIDMEFCWLI